MPTRNLTTRLRRIALAVAAIAAAMLGQTASSEAAVSYSGRVGLNTHLVWVSQSDALAVFKEIRAGGVDWVREEFPWSVVEPQQGTFTWSRTDAMMAAASQANVNVLGILGYSAPWASSDPSGGGDTKYPPRDSGAYARYAAAVVARYGPGGAFWAARPDLQPRPLTAVQIWNEPWGYWFWKPNPNPTAYALLARRAAEAINAVNPNTTILIPGDLLQVRTDRTIVDWLRNLRAADPGLTSLVDAYSVHPYPDPRTNGPYQDRSDPRWDYGRVALVHQIDPSLPIWITEIGWSTANTSDSVTEATQATFVTGAVTRAMTDWGSFVDRIFLYSFDRDSGNTADREGYYGLRRQDGTPKPAWGALRTLIASGTSPTPAPVPVPAFTIAMPSPKAGQTLTAPVVWEAVASGATVQQIDFAIDGVHKWTERVAPYRYNGDTAMLDPRALSPGSHTLTVTATAADGRAARASVTVKVQAAKKQAGTRSLTAADAAAVNTASAAKGKVAKARAAKAKTAARKRAAAAKNARLKS